MARVIPHDLLAASQRELSIRLAAGHRFDPSGLAGHVYRGVSLGLPAWVDRLAWKKFAKAFDSDGRGWNIRIQDDGLDRPWRPLLREGQPVTFGHFTVVEGEAGVRLDYGRLCDPLVALSPSSSDVLLGRSLLSIGKLRVPTPSFFVLTRGGPLTDSAW